MTKSKKVESESLEKMDENNTSEKKTVKNGLDGNLEQSLETLSSAFTASARRWEAIVYPSMFAFILLAIYGFYLIYNLTSDVSRVADNMEHIVTSMSEMSVNMEVVSHNMVVMTQTLDSQSNSMQEMTFYIRNMDVSMRQMRYDISTMNNSVSRPMQFMNTFMPW